MRKPTKLIQVTKKEILAGRQCSPTFCPVALALRRAYHVSKIRVDGALIRIKGSKYHHQSSRLNNFIIQFDLGQLVKPFSFRLSDLEKI